MAAYSGPEISNSGLVVHLDAANKRSYSGTGTTWFDLSGNGNDGILTNGPTFSNTNNGSIVFDGNTNYVNLPINNIISGWTSITYNVWVFTKQISTTNWVGYISANTTSASANISVGQWQNLQKIWYEIDTTNGNFFGGGPGSNTFNLNVWNNISLVYDGANTYGYLNANLDIQFAATGNLRTITQLTIGSQNNSYLNGNISSAQIYNRALTAAEIRQNFEATRDRYGI